jgi:hypothetical protein
MIAVAHEMIWIYLARLFKEESLSKKIRIKIIINLECFLIVFHYVFIIKIYHYNYLVFQSRRIGSSAEQLGHHEV